MNWKPEMLEYQIYQVISHLRKGIDSVVVNNSFYLSNSN